jgi:EAL and modified HD-GYP domain-containing signal transduction protein
MGDRMTKPALGASVFIARQPIFDRKKDVFGYELLFRSGQENQYEAADGDASTLDLIAGSFLVIGLDELTGGKRGFINFTRNLLLDNVAALLPKELVTVEILEDIVPDEKIMAACRHLKASGYMLALDDFVMASSGSPLLELADIVKVDFLGTTPEERRRLADECAARHIRALAEKVETIDDFEAALVYGYSYFQGNFFAKPVIRSGNRVSANKLSHLRMLNEVNRTELSYDQLEGVIKQDVSLTYNLLRFINSAWFGLRYQITSIKHALVLLGPKEIRKWFALVALRFMGADKPSELLLRSLTRARMGESLAPLVGMLESGPELFLLGMFSVIDALLDLPMPEVVAKLPLSDQVQKALLGEPCAFKTVFDALMAYEKGDWATFLRLTAELNLDPSRAPEIYIESLKWATEAFALS